MLCVKQVRRFHVIIFTIVTPWSYPTFRRMTFDWENKTSPNCNRLHSVMENKTEAHPDTPLGVVVGEARAVDAVGQLVARHPLAGVLSPLGGDLLHLCEATEIDLQPLIPVVRCR